MTERGPERGIVFAATGEFYRKLARRAARNVREVMPDIPIDLYTEAPLDDPVFSAVHLLKRPKTPRPKMEALRTSRFDRTLYLDVDVVMVAPVDEVFDVLGQFDIAGAHELFGSAPVSMMSVRKPIPPAFRQINGGVLGIRKSPGTDAFLTRWEEDFHGLNLQYDQPLLQELLWDTDLRLAVLPPEYNMMFMPWVRHAGDRMMAPRLLHLVHLHTKKVHADPADQPFDLEKLVSPQVVQRISELGTLDRTLGARPLMTEVAADALRRVPVIYRLAKKAWHARK